MYDEQSKMTWRIAKVLLSGGLLWSVLGAQAQARDQYRYHPEEQSETRVPNPAIDRDPNADIDFSAIEAPAETAPLSSTPANRPLPFSGATASASASTSTPTTCTGDRNKDTKPCRLLRGPPPELNIAAGLNYNVNVNDYSDRKWTKLHHLWDVCDDFKEDLSVGDVVSCIPWVTYYGRVYIRVVTTQPK